MGYVKNNSKLLSGTNQASVVHPVPARSWGFRNGPDLARTQNLLIFWYFLGIYSPFLGLKPSPGHSPVPKKIEWTRPGTDRNFFSLDHWSLTTVSSLSSLDLGGFRATGAYNAHYTKPRRG